MTDPSAQPIASPSTSASRVDERKKSRGFVGCLLLHAAKKVGIIEETRLALEFVTEMDIYYKYQDAVDGLVGRLEACLQMNPEVLAKATIEAPECEDPYEVFARAIKQFRQSMPEDKKAIDRIAPSLDNPYLHGSSEFSDDPNTTNLYLANLPPTIEQNDLFETFGTFGPLASAKILYPRGEDDPRKGSMLSGFVAFMSRTDAERAMAVMGGSQIKGIDIRVSWARPVVLPAAPFFVPPSLRELAMPDPPSGLPFNAKPQPSELSQFMEKYKELPQFGAPLPIDNPELVRDYKEMLKNSIIRVVIPTERPLLFLIHRCIEFLIRDGPMFEACLMEQTRMDPTYRFLFDNNHPTHVYYRWKLFSILNGDNPMNWRIERFRMFQDGSWWEPPPLNLYDGGMPPQLYNRAYKPEKAKRISMLERSRSNSPNRKRSRFTSQGEEVEPARLRGVLSTADREYLEDMLRDLTPEKNSIGNSMVWVLDHADCAKEIVQCLFESLDIPETPLSKKIARFYLVNDILGNCGVRVKDVFYYRQYLQDYLERIFVSLNATLESIESRIKAEQFRQRIMLCFRMWEDNTVYTRDILIKLQNVFLGLIKPSVASESNETDEEDLDGVPLNSTNLDDDEDLDGVPISFPAPSSRKRSPAPQKPHTSKHHQLSPDTSSKWNKDTLDNFASKWDAPETSEPVKEHKEPELTPKHVGNPEKNGNSEKTKLISNDARDEERRRLLREVEVKIVEYQDELEADGLLNTDKKLADYRQKLMEKMEKELEEFDEGQLHASTKKPSSSSRHDDRRESKSKKRHSSKERDRRSRSRDRERKRRRSRSRSRSRHRSRTPKRHRSRR